MKSFIVFSAIMAVAFAHQGVYLAPHYATLAAPLTITKLVPGAPIGLDGRVVDTPEVSLAKAEHAAAHINEKINLAHEAVKSADQVISYASPVWTSSYEPHTIAKIVPAAPIGLDGRVVDTPEVTLAKAEHAAAHLNEKLVHSAKSTLDLPVVISPYSAPLVQKLWY